MIRPPTPPDSTARSTSPKAWRGKTGIISCWRAASLLLAAALPTFGAFPSIETRISREDRRTLQQEALIVIQLLQNYHYASRPFHELEAPEFLDRYLDRIDPDHLFLTATDVTFIHRRFDRNLKTVYLFSGDLHPAFEIQDLFITRALARCDWVGARLQQPIALDRAGEIVRDRGKVAWPTDATAADALWEQWLQLQLGSEIIDGRSVEQAVDLVRARNTRYRTRIAGCDPLAVREQFLTCLLEFFDPHSGYFSRATADEFNIEMAGSVAGIGLDLKVADGRFFVQALYPGGPCDRLGTVHTDDELVALAEEGAPAQPLAGLRLREVVRLARGRPGSLLAVTLRPAGSSAPPQTVTVVRARVDLPANHASGFLVHVASTASAVPIGLIRLPAFYGGQAADGTETSMAEEVRELLTKLTGKGARSIVIDLRENGGGLMHEAAKLAGLFLQGGPIVYAQGADARAETLRDDDPAAAFAGPLVVLTSPRSASASEAFAGAMQCYRRGLVVGAGTTFGKGTAQSYIDVRDLTNVSPSLQRLGGVARVTRQLYYLPDGRSPQLDGIQSDIVLPSYHFPGEQTEDKMPHALPAASISPPEPMPAAAPALAHLTPELLQSLRTRTAERLASLPEFALRQRWIAHYAERWSNTALALPLEERRRQENEQQERLNALRRDQRQLGEQLAFPHERVDLAIVAGTRETHQQILRDRHLADGAPCANRYDHGIFYYPDPDNGKIHAIPVAALDLEDCRAAAVALAEAWTAATGISLDAVRVRAILADLAHQREYPDPGVDVPALFRRHCADPLDESQLTTGLTAFFRAAIEADGDLLRDLPQLDISLRESLRLAADWAELVPTAASTPLPAPPERAEAPPLPCHPLCPDPRPCAPHSSAASPFLRSAPSPPPLPHRRLP